MALEPILDIPFDEADGSTVAHDYAPGAHHAAIAAGNFVPGRFGNCVYFAGEGKAEILPPVIDYTQDFSFTIWVLAERKPEGPRRSWAMFKFPGVDNFINIELFTTFAFWQNVTIVQEGNEVRVYVDAIQKGGFTKTGNMTGLAVLNDSTHKTGGWCRLDGARAFDRAIEVDEIDEIVRNAYEPVAIKLGNIDSASLGLNVERIEGLLDMLERKEPLTVQWLEYSGEIVDLAKPVYSYREIILRCWMRADTHDALMSQWMQLVNIIQSPGLVRLHFDAGTKPLVFDVYQRDRIDTAPQFKVRGPHHHRFNLVFREPLPIKRVLRVNGTSCSVTLTCPSPVRVSWGDGTATNNLTNGTVTHNYSGSGPWFVIVAGEIDDISSFSTDAIIVWSKI